MTQYRLEISLLSDIGCCRQVNQDFITAASPHDPGVMERRGTLVVVADGMGGHRGGEVASRMAAESIQRTYYANVTDNVPEAVTKAFLEANAAIYQCGQDNPELQGMGTTASALILRDHQVFIGHVGDTRIYRLCGDGIEQLTEDHTLIMEMVKSELISREDALHHPDRHILTRALGTHPTLEIFAPAAGLPIDVGDRFVLCSDGLYDLVANEEIRTCAFTRDPHQTCVELIAMAKQRGGPDNISVGVVEIRALDLPRPAPRDTLTG